MTARDFIESNVVYLEGDAYQFCQFMYNELPPSTAAQVVLELKQCGIDITKERWAALDIAIRANIAAWKHVGGKTMLELEEFIETFLSNYMGFTITEIADWMYKNRHQFPQVDIDDFNTYYMIELR